MHYCDFSGILFNALFLAQFRIKEPSHIPIKIILWYERGNQGLQEWKNGWWVRKFELKYGDGSKQGWIDVWACQQLLLPDRYSFLLSSTLLLSSNGTVWSRIFILTCNTFRQFPLLSIYSTRAPAEADPTIKATLITHKKKNQPWSPMKFIVIYPVLWKCSSTHWMALPGRNSQPAADASRYTPHLPRVLIRSLSRYVPSDGPLPKMTSPSSSRKACTAKIGWPRPSSLIWARISSLRCAHRYKDVVGVNVISLGQHVAQPTSTLSRPCSKSKSVGTLKPRLSMLRGVILLSVMLTRCTFLSGVRWLDTRARKLEFGCYRASDYKEPVGEDGLAKFGIGNRRGDSRFYRMVLRSCKMWIFWFYNQNFVTIDACLNLTAPISPSARTRIAATASLPNDQCVRWRLWCFLTNCNEL